MNPEKCLLGKMQRRRLWVNLRKYCDDLFAADLPATHRFEPPPYAADKFTKLGLRHPRNPRALRKFYDNFIPRCGHLAENGGNDKKRKWKPKPGSAGCNGSPPPSSMSSLSGSASPGHRCSPPPQQTSQAQAQVQSATQSMHAQAIQAMKMQQMKQMQAMQQKARQAQGVSAMQGMPSGIPSGIPSVGSVPAMPTQAQQIDQISRWLASNCFEVPTPQSLHGVPINRSPMRRNGLNILSTGYSTKHPDPAQTLQRNEPMIVFGAQRDAQKYGPQQMPAQAADPAFCREMVNKRMLFVPVPPCLVGSTLAETPQLSQAGINALSVNMRVQQPAVMAKRRFVVGDTLICLFDDSFVDKHEKLTAVFDEIQRVKKRLNLRND